MKILRVTDSTCSQHEINLFSDYGMVIALTHPTPFSSFTAMKIAKAADKEAPDIVEVRSQKDALAAISAKKVTKCPGYKIVYVVEPNSAVPPVFHKPVVNDVDCWMFLSPRLMEEFPQNLKNKILLSPVSYTNFSVDSPDLAASPITISWIGDITDTERLKNILEQVDELNGNFRLRICGAGKARDVMPAVRLSRALQHHDKVEWVGEVFDTEKEIEKCQAAVYTDKDLTRLQSIILKSGRPILHADEVADFIAAPHPIKAEDRPDLNSQLLKIQETYINLTRNNSL